MLLKQNFFPSPLESSKQLLAELLSWQMQNHSYASSSPPRNLDSLVFLSFNSQVEMNSLLSQLQLNTTHRIRLQL